MNDQDQKAHEFPQVKAVPTLEDVAKHAQVSTATVSRCLNSPDQVVERTRKRVMDAVQELGYAPNFSARALAAKRTKTIGAVIPTMDNAIFARGLQAFQEEIGNQGYTLLVASSFYQDDLEEEQIRTLIARGADALLLIGYRRSDTIRKFLETRNVPTVVTWAYDKNEDDLSVGFSNVESMATLVRRAINIGHRRMGMISAWTESNDRALGRKHGVLSAASEAGIDASSVAIVETDYGIETGAKAFQDLMSRTPRPTVVFCGNDVLAIGAMRAAKTMGMSVPEDVSITGFDGIELASLADPALTTVHVPHREMGRRAALSLISVLNGATDTPSEELRTDIWEGASLGPAP